MHATEQGTILDVQFCHPRKRGVNISNMSLCRENVGGEALTVLEVDSVPPQAALDELTKDTAIKSARVVTL